MYVDVFMHFVILFSPPIPPAFAGVIRGAEGSEKFFLFLFVEKDEKKQTQALRATLSFLQRIVTRVLIQ
jgi:hypothetical protein